MLKHNKFDLSQETYEQFRDATRAVVEELKTKDGLFPQALGEYLNQQGKIFFTGNNIDEAKMVSFMALVTEFIINKENTSPD